MNYWRWLIVGYLLALMVFTTSVLLIPREKYDTLTTSDSGWFFGIAREMDSADGMVEKYSLSHAPHGLSLGYESHGQPLLLVMLYRGLHALDPSLSLMDMCRYWSPLLFALALIPIFLIAKELGGDWAGCGATFFGATLTGSIYWCKVGAFDREALQLVLTAWVIYLAVKSFKAHGWKTLEFGVLGGLVLGIFGLSWGGFLYLATMLVLWLFLTIASEWLRYLAPIFLAGMLIAMYSGEVIYMLYAFVGTIVLAGIIEAIAEIYVRRVSLETFLRGLLRAFRTHSLLIGGVVTMFVVATATLVFLGGVSPRLWESFVLQQLGHVGIGGAAQGVSFPRYAGEMAPPGSWDETITRFYEAPGCLPSADVLTKIVFVFAGLALVKICWSRKRWELLTIAWLPVLLGLVWPGLGQARFDRMWWPFVAVMGGVGVGALVSAFKRLSREPVVAEWLAPVQKPLTLAFCASLIAMLFVSNVSPISFVSNAYGVAERTTPPTEWHGRGLDEGFMDVFAWLRDNTPENSVVAIEWSFGHVLTGTANRAVVCDGCETMGEIGKWENASVRPPDYIYRVIGNEGIFLESFVPWEAPPLGRRSDMQWIFAMDDEELADLLELYLSYGVHIDYLVFHLAIPWTQRDAVSRPRIKDVEAETRSISQIEQVFSFDFGGENVTFDAKTGEVLRNGDNLIGYVVGKEIVDENGNIFHLYAGASLPHLEDAGVWKSLLIYVREEGGRIWLTGGALCAAPEKLPVGTLIAFEMLEEDSYLQVVHRSQIGWNINRFYTPLVKIVKVNHLPSLIFPFENARINDDAPTFRWFNAIGVARCELWVDDDADFSSPEILENVSGTYHTPAVVLTDGTYSWRVRAFKVDDAELGWSPTWTFIIDTTPPAAATLHAPENGKTIIDNTLTFEWMLGAGATKHRLIVDDDTDFSSPEVEVILEVPENTHTSSELAAGNYCWKVIAIDDANNENESPIWEFIVQS